MKASGFALSLGLGLAMAFLSPGCGSSRSPHSTQGDAQMPAFIAGQLGACAEERKTHLGIGQHAISFELEFNEDGQVDEVALKDSTLEDQGLEACMVRVLRSLSVDDLPLRASENASSEPAKPESKALMGQEQVLLCMASPPCLMAMGLLIGASFLVVQIYVSQASIAKPWAAPMATFTPSVVPKGSYIPVKSKDECTDRYVACTEYTPRAPCGACMTTCAARLEWPRFQCP